MKGGLNINVAFRIRKKRWIAQGWVTITRIVQNSDLDMKPKKKNNFGLILFVYNLITGRSK